MELQVYLNQLKQEFKNYLHKHNIDNVVIGISGGIDSAVSLALLCDVLTSDQILAYFIDIESNKDDFTDAQKVCDSFNVKLNYLNLDKPFNELLKYLNTTNDIAKGNIKSRLRMITLYNEAFNHKAIVIGNSNLDELYLGYFTKHGDSAADYYLLSGLIKSDIYEIAKNYQIPSSIINKPPSPGLIKGIDDINELKYPYDTIDAFLTGKNVQKDAENYFKKIHQRNKHKLTYNMYVNKSSKYRKI